MGLQELNKGSNSQHVNLSNILLRPNHGYMSTKNTETVVAIHLELLNGKVDYITNLETFNDHYTQYNTLAHTTSKQHWGLKL